MTKQERNREDLGRDIQGQLLEDRTGEKEIRVRSQGSKAAVIRTQGEAFKAIIYIARCAMKLSE